MKAGVIETRGSKDYPVKEDNWEHRSEKMKCLTCMKYVPKKNGLGRCRHNAPTDKGWAPVFDTDYCFQHRLDENKIGTETGGLPDNLFEKFKPQDGPLETP